MLRDHLALRISGETELPARSQAPIDLTHLARMTLGDRRLQQEILDLFDQQIGLLIARMNDRHAATLGALAHTLKGSARSIGAWDLVRATEAAVASAAPLDQAIAVVEATGARVREAISQMRQNEADVDAAL
jgi:HPt (histidine-containing phosphotransfer) domain-containing protein